MASQPNVDNTSSAHEQGDDVSKTDAITKAQARKSKHLVRVLSFDGGGIYGLFTVLLLKELCRRDPKFLNGDDHYLFAGTSAGALTALTLARAESPRDVLLSGHLESLFTDPRLYTKKLGLRTLTSLTGLTSWTGGENAQALFRDYFGDTRFGDLQNNVLICTFDLYGDPAKGDDQRWGPRLFHSLDAANADLSVAHIAYGATAPVQWREVRNGLTDGGIFADNPIMPAITEVMQHDRHWDYARGAYDLNHTNEYDDLEKYRVLNDLRVLSVGVGNQVPHYAFKDSDFGYLTFGMVPTNLRKKFLWPPLPRLLLEPSVESATDQATALLGERFHRLDPAVIGFPIPPVLASMYLSRFRTARHVMEAVIRDGMNKAKTNDEILKAYGWLQDEWHKEPKGRPDKEIALSASAVVSDGPVK